jgi:hypothetical protein
VCSPISIPEGIKECELTVVFFPILTFDWISTKGPIFTLSPNSQPYKFTGSTIETFSPNFTFLIPLI